MAIPSSSARSCRCSFQVLDRLLLLPPESAQIRILFTPCLRLLPASFHHRRMLSTANSAVSCVTPTLTTARSSPISYVPDRKSTRLNSSHLVISYAVFCL